MPSNEITREVNALANFTLDRLGAAGVAVDRGDSEAAFLAWNEITQTAAQLYLIANAQLIRMGGRTVKV